jgi:hypothetical protein
MGAGRSRAEAGLDAASRRPRLWLSAGGLLILVGLAVVGIEPSDAGMVITLAGLAAMIFAIHTFGRLGPEERRS